MTAEPWVRLGEIAHARASAGARRTACDREVPVARRHYGEADTDRAERCPTCARLVSLRERVRR